jgi:hypothetical protein
MNNVIESGGILHIEFTKPVVLGESKPMVRHKQDQAAA